MATAENPLIVDLVSDEEDGLEKLDTLSQKSDEFVPFRADEIVAPTANDEIVTPTAKAVDGMEAEKVQGKKPKTRAGQTEVKSNMHSHEGLPLMLPKVFKNEATVLASLSGSYVDKMAHHSGALGRMEIDQHRLSLEINGQRYIGPICPTVSCMIVTMAKDHGVVTNLVSDFCPLTSSKSTKKTVKGLLVSGELDMEDTEAMAQRKRKAAILLAGGSKKKKSGSKRRTKKQVK